MNDRIKKIFANSSNYLLVILALIVGFILGIGAVYFFNKSKSPTAFPIREKSGGKYNFINPLIGFEVSDKKEFDEYLPLQRKIENLVDNYKNQKKAKSIAVYYRNMENGWWIGVNENEEYSPASLYKVVLMIAYLKKAETDSSLLSQKIVFTGTREKGIPDYKPMTIGQSYTILELIKRLIISSDNDAKNLLHDYLNQRYVNDVFSDLGLESPGINETGDSMSAKSYSRFFRILYSSTYLTREMSELALEILSRADFKEGIILGLPTDVVFAHKYGYRTFDLSEKSEVSKELHDCGIVYFPNSPYFLCVMTKGWENGDLKEVIGEISKTVYQEVENLNKKQK